jgi:HEAT repeat protein
LAPHFDTVAGVAATADDSTRNALLSLFRDARAVPALGMLAADEDPRVRHAALGALRSLRAAGAPAVATVIARIDDADSDVAVAAAQCLAAMQAEAQRSVAALDRRLREDVPARLKRACAVALGAFGPAAAGSADLWRTC